MLLKPGCDLRNTQHNTQQKWPVLKNRKFSIFYATRQIRCVLRSSRTQPLTTKNRKQRTVHIAIFEKFISPDLMCQFWWFISFCDPAIVVYNPVPEFLWNSRISVQLMVNLSKWRKKSEKKIIQMSWCLYLVYCYCYWSLNLNLKWFIWSSHLYK